MSGICLTCGGMIFTAQDGSFGYAGPVCTCYAPPRIQRPSQQFKIEFDITKIQRGKPAPYEMPQEDELLYIYKKQLERLEAEVKLYREALEELEIPYLSTPLKKMPRFPNVIIREALEAGYKLKGE
jgi:hypothetical protein